MLKKSAAPAPPGSAGKLAGGLAPRDLWMLVALTVIWGVNWPVMKVGVRSFPPMSFRVLCMVGGMVVLLAFVRSQRISLRIPRAQWGELALIGLFNMVVWYVLSIYGVKLLASGRAAILGYTLPIWTAVLGWVIYRENPGRRLWLGVAAAALGVALLLSSEFATISGRPLGVLLMLMAAAVWGLGTHLMRRRSPGLDVIPVMFWSLAQSLVICGLVALVLERRDWLRWPDTIEWGAIVYNAVLVFGFAQIAWFRLVTLLPPVASTLSVMLIPVIGLFSGIAMIGEVPHWQDYAALVSILVAIGTVLWPQLVVYWRQRFGA